MRPVSEQIKAFRSRKTPLAAGVDEYGDVEGMVTLEEILRRDRRRDFDEPRRGGGGVRAQPDGSVV